jgi:hypothetical protein
LVHSGTFVSEGFRMDIAIVFDWFAQESKHAAEQTKDPKQREILVKLALMWATAAQHSDDEAHRRTPKSVIEGADLNAAH